MSNPQDPNGQQPDPYAQPDPYVQPDPYAQGGYLERGFGDLDWLPEPSLGEVKP